MSILSDHIEQFIQEMMQQATQIALQRNELAQHFDCAPSQINYVLSTRFTLDKGYIIVSQRGGGGYIRITKIDMDKHALLHHLATQRVEKSLSLHEAKSIVSRLEREQIVTPREARLMLSAMSNCALPVVQLQDQVRANIMQSMLVSLLEEQAQH